MRITPARLVVMWLALAATALRDGVLLFTHRSDNMVFGDIFAVVFVVALTSAYAEWVLMRMNK